MTSQESANECDCDFGTHSTVIVRVFQLTELVKMLLCLTCQCATVAVRQLQGAGLPVGDLLQHM